MTNQQVIKKAIERKQKRLMTALIKRAARNFGKQRFSKFLPNSETTSGMNANGSKGFAQVEGKRLGTQNKGATIPRRVPKKGKALRFLKRKKGDGTLIPNNLDSKRPKKATKVVFAKSAKGFKLTAGRWDLANKKDVLENLQSIVKEA